MAEISPIWTARSTLNTGNVRAMLQFSMLPGNWWSFTFANKESMTPHFKELLNTFNENEVRYLIVGAYAVMKYSDPRFTKDLDIWVDATLDNASKVYDSLKSFGAPLDGLTVTDFASSGFYQMGRPPVRIDVLMNIDGVDFDSAWKNRENADFDGIPANFIGLPDLLTNKRATARPQDMVDLQNLEKKSAS